MADQEGYLEPEDGIRLFFQKVGNGADVVVIPNAFYMFAEFRQLAADRTIIAYDLRNRARSSAVLDVAKLRGGIHHDVEDLEAVRRYFGLERINVIAHSYLGMAVMLYAMKYASRVNRMVLIGPVPPDQGKEYPADSTGADRIMAEVSAKMTELQQSSAALDPKEFARRMWLLMRTLYVADPADADKVQWSVEDLPNESLFNVMKHYSDNVLPSMQRIHLTPQDFAAVTAPFSSFMAHATATRPMAAAETGRCDCLTRV